MKLISTIFLLVILVSCKKESNPFVDNPSVDPIFGRWRWFKTWQTFVGYKTPQSTGKTAELTLGIDSIYTFTGDFFPAQSNVFHITMRPIPGGGIPVPHPYITMVHPPNYSNYDWNYWFIGSNNDTLRMDDHVESDGDMHFFVRIQ